MNEHSVSLSTPAGQPPEAAAPAPEPEHPRIHQSPFSGEPEVILRGVVQSVSPEEALGRTSYWATMVPDARPDRALILGFGAGTIAALLTRRFGPIPIEGVDLNPKIVEVGYAICGLAEANLTIHYEDAFAFVDRAQGHYDYVGVDLYLGGELVQGVFAKTFLRRLKRLAGPRGTVAFNIIRTRRYDRQMARLHEIFPVVETAEAGLNVVAKCRAG